MKLWFAILVICSTVNCDVDFASVIDKSQYEKGKDRFEELQKWSQNPRYGKCWTNTVDSLQESCKTLTDVKQRKLALQYMNCFLELLNSKTCPCEDSPDVKQCMHQSKEECEVSLLGTFFTHTQNICYFLKAQVWQESTLDLIHDLRSTASQVVKDIETATNLQKKTLGNQKIMIRQSVNLSHMINASVEQLNSINRIVGAIQTFQKVIYGEISWIMTVVYYINCTLVSYFLTSISRTQSARGWLYVILFVNGAVEFFLVNLFTNTSMNLDDIQFLQNAFRIFFTIGSLMVLFYHFVTYQNPSNLRGLMESTVELLKEIKELMTELKQDRNQDEVQNTDNLSAASSSDSSVPPTDREEQGLQRRSTQGEEQSPLRNQEDEVQNTDNLSAASSSDLSFPPTHREEQGLQRRSTQGEEQSPERNQEDEVQNTDNLSASSSSDLSVPPTGREEEGLQRRSTQGEEQSPERNQDDNSPQPSHSSPSTPKSKSNYNLRKRTPRQIKDPAFKGYGHDFDQK